MNKSFNVRFTTNQWVAFAMIAANFVAFAAANAGETQSSTHSSEEAKRSILAEIPIHVDYDSIEEMAVGGFKMDSSSRLQSGGMLLAVTGWESPNPSMRDQEREKGKKRDLTLKFALRDVNAEGCMKYEFIQPLDFLPTSLSSPGLVALAGNELEIERLSMAKCEGLANLLNQQVDLMNQGLLLIAECNELNSDSPDMMIGYQGYDVSKIKSFQEFIAKTKENFRARNIGTPSPKTYEAFQKVYYEHIEKVHTPVGHFHVLKVTVFSSDPNSCLKQSDKNPIKVSETTDSVRNIHYQIKRLGSGNHALSAGK